MGTEDTEHSVMLELAAQAFQAHNFQLAADIYGEQLRQSACDGAARQELTLRRADALALDGRLAEACEAYRAAARLVPLPPAQLELLLGCLCARVRVGERQRDDLGCDVCAGLLYEPVTLPCGHSVCRRCVPRVACCSGRGEARRLHHRINVLLNTLLWKWLPGRMRAASLRHEGNALYACQQPGAALEKYSQAISLAPSDHVLYSNRSLINSSLRNFEDSLKDAEMACKLQPHWLKGHLRKAQALLSLRNTEEALAEYLFCLALEPESKLAKSEALKLLSDVFAPVPDHMQETIPDCSRLLSTRVRMKGSPTSTSSSCCSDTFTGFYRDCKKSESSRDSAQAEEKSTPVPAFKLNKEQPEGRSACCEGDAKHDLSLSTCHSTLIDRRYFLKRKRSAEDGEGLDSKRVKPEPTLKEEVTLWCAEVAGLIDASDLECSLCMRLFYEPVTTPCGHTFCLKCLERCLDHNSQCPLCKEDLAEYLAQREYCKNLLLESLIAKYLPEELVERQRANEEEMAELSNLNKNVPIFVCTMAFPTVPCPLHIFEPCYRLMVRRCMETGTKQFGMCLSNSLTGFADYGCMLEIRNVEFFADGRSVVDTIGRRRFKVLRHSQRDGYNTADIEYLEDKKVEGEDEDELRKLHDAVYDQALVWVNSLKAEQKERIIGHFGPMPEKDREPQVGPNGPSWCWWLLAVLPLEGRAQLPFLALTSLKERLSGIRKVLLFMSRSRPR